jgi:hypothetical protein
MIASTVLRFPACGLLWTCEILDLGPLAGLDLDRAPPDFTMNVLSVLDGRMVPVHPRYLTPLLQGGSATSSTIRGAALNALVFGAREILEGPSGSAPITADLVKNPQEALDRWLPMNGTRLA